MYDTTPVTPIQNPPKKRSGWSKLSHNSHVAIIVGICLFVVLVVGVVVAVIFTRPKNPPTPTTTTSSTVTPTTSPTVLNTILLKDNNDQCYEFPKLPAVMGAPGTCTGVWIQNETSKNLSFDGISYEYCTEYPSGLSQSVYGVTGRGCTGVVIEDNHVKALKAGPNGIDLCINNIRLWDNCVNALTFVIEPINHTISRLSL